MSRHSISRSGYRRFRRNLRRSYTANSRGARMRARRSARRYRRSRKY